MVSEKERNVVDFIITNGNFFVTTKRDFIQRTVSRVTAKYLILLN